MSLGIVMIQDLSSLRENTGSIDVLGWPAENAH